MSHLSFQNKHPQSKGHKELDTTDWLNNNNPTHIQLLQSKNDKEFWKLKRPFFTLNIFFFIATIYRENWSILSNPLHRPQSGEALWARVFLNPGSSSMYSWVKIPKGYQIRGFPGGPSDKEPTCQCKRCSFDPGVGKIPWRREWHPTPVSLPGKSHGQKSLVGYSPCGHKELNITELT